jgi:hypothetical protein
MAKTTVDNIVAKIKRRADYNITDSGLDTLIIDMVVDATKVMKQLFLDAGIYDEIGKSGSFSTVANQAYVDIATAIPDLDEVILHTERTNDRHIPMISYADYLKLIPDPTADKTNTPDYAARFYNRIYFYPTPSEAITIYLDYIRLLDDVSSGDTLPFEGKYDPLLIAMVKTEFMEWLDPNNATAIALAIARVDTLKDELIVGAAKNIGQNKQCHSRRSGILSPKQQMTRPVYGFGVGGFGEGGFGGL